MSKVQAIAASTILLLAPGLFLAYLLVMMFISHSEDVTTFMQIVAGIGLLVSIIAIIYPVICLFLAPSLPKVKRAKKGAAAGAAATEDAADSETFESDEMDTFDDDEESEEFEAAPQTGVEVSAAAESSEYETIEFETDDFDDSEEFEAAPQTGVEVSAAAPSSEYETIEFETSDFEEEVEEFKPSGGLDDSVDLDSGIFMEDLESAVEIPSAESSEYETIEFDTEDFDDGLSADDFEALGDDDFSFDDDDKKK